MNMLQAILVELDRPGSHIVYNTLTKQAMLCSGYPAPISPISAEELLALVEKAWITRYDSLDGKHCYRITESGKKAIG
jgi:hypothetical protein